MILFDSLSKTLQNIILHHVSCVFPSEGCGLIFCDKNTHESFVFPVTNIQDILTGDETDTIMFTMDTRFICTIASHFIASDIYKLEAMYHSHTQNTPLQLSDLDKSRVFQKKNILYFPDISYIIFDVFENNVRNIHNYVWNYSLKDFNLIENLTLP